MKPYRGTVLRPNESGEILDMIDDAVVLVDDTGKIVVADSIDDLRTRTSQLSGEFGLHVGGPVDLDGEPLRPSHQVLMPVTANTHDHSFQPPGIPGQLIVGDPDRGFTGWLPETLKRGESVAKGQIERARAMLVGKYREFIKHGVGATLQYTTSSLDAAREAILRGDEHGLRVVAGFVAMDQNMDGIHQGLEVRGDDALSATEALLDEFDASRVAVIDRFPIAVSSETRRRLAELARRYGALYETHLDEQDGEGCEKAIHSGIYGTSSVVETLINDGVFDSGSRVGLAHSIHTTPREMDDIAECVTRGCKVYVRACPSSNAQLGSHFVGGAFVPFPLRDWEQRGVRITLGTDRGAGRTSSMFAEMLKEHGRHPADNRPSYQEVLKFGTLSGLESLGIDTRDTSIREGNMAEFVAVKMSGNDGFYEPHDHHGNPEFTAARIADGGQDSSGVEALWVKGKQLK